MANVNTVKKRIEDYQALSTVHPLTCGNDSNDILYPYIEEDKVVLLCKNPTCDYKQTYIPDLFLNEKFDQFLESQQKLDAMLNKKD